MGEAGVIHTEALIMTTKGQGDFLKIEPKENLIFARSFLTECTNSALNGTDSIGGTVKGVPDGSTLKFTHAAVTTEGSLHGQLGTSTQAGVEGSLTLKGRDPKIAEAIHPAQPNNSPDIGF